MNNTHSTQRQGAEKGPGPGKARKAEDMAAGGAAD